MNGGSRNGPLYRLLVQRSSSTSYSETRQRQRPFTTSATPRLGTSFQVVKLIRAISFLAWQHHIATTRLDFEVYAGYINTLILLEIRLKNNIQGN